MPNNINLPKIGSVRIHEIYTGSVEREGLRTVRYLVYLMLAGALSILILLLFENLFYFLWQDIVEPQIHPPAPGEVRRSYILASYWHACTIRRTIPVSLAMITLTFGLGVWGYRIVRGSTIVDLLRPLKGVVPLALCMMFTWLATPIFGRLLIPVAGKRARIFLPSVGADTWYLGTRTDWSPIVFPIAGLITGLLLSLPAIARIRDAHIPEKGKPAEARPIFHSLSISFFSLTFALLFGNTIWHIVRVIHYTLW